MTSAITIRPLRRTDFPAVEELIRQAWYDDGCQGCAAATDAWNDSSKEPSDVGSASRQTPRERKTRLRRGIHVRNMHRLAAIDLQDALARTTTAFVAERDGRVLGMILGSVRSHITDKQRTRHSIRRNCLALPLMFSAEGRHGVSDQLAILRADRELEHDAGKKYAAEVVLFVVSASARGMGVGRRLFAHMLHEFRHAGIREYFLFTDTTCDYGFYDHRGLERRAARTMRFPSFTQSDGDKGGAVSFFLYDGSC
ncbi:MAG TPA: GNAT family N-acetyltransferase [Bifidobacterium sp.]|nr:GNAT family N-acetyltransferase [Bifidobacterium sp.]